MKNLHHGHSESRAKRWSTLRGLRCAQRTRPGVPVRKDQAAARGKFGNPPVRMTLQLTHLLIKTRPIRTGPGQELLRCSSVFESIWTERRSGSIASLNRCFLL
jgi:hypothetical protein